MTMTNVSDRHMETTNGNGQQTLVRVVDHGTYANLLDSDRFNQCWRVARMFAATTMIPAHFQNKPEDCFVGIQMAMRLNIDPLMFLQNTYVTQGKPGMEGKLAISLVNTSGLFSGPLQYEYSGQKGSDDWGCTAWAKTKDGSVIRGPTVTIGIAKAEGWHGRNPKWKNIPELMLLYRAGAWFGRTVCPERLMGMQTIDELHDAGAVELLPASRPATVGTPPQPADIMARLTAKPVSESQTFEPSPEAVAAIAAQDSVIDEPETPAARTHHPATESGEKTREWCNGHAVGSGVTETDLATASDGVLLPFGLKGKGPKTTPEQRQAVIDAIGTL